MDISGEYRLQAPREKVWEALNDPECLKRALPGCEELEKVADNEFQGKIESKIGPVKAKFTTKVSLTNLNPPQSYTIVGEGKGGASGFAKGSADVSLVEDGADTILHYESKFQVGGKLAQIGNRLVGGAARKTADEFFANFAAIINPPAAQESETETDAEPASAKTAPTPSTGPAPAAPSVAGGGNKMFFWIAAAVSLILLLWFIF